MNDPVFIIVIDKATPDEVSAVHELVKMHSREYWWHRMADIWIVTGLTASRWRDLIKPALPTSASSALVMKLPAKSGDRSWAFVGPDAKDRCQWIHDYYA